jgi:hypothetical protein
MRGNDMQAIDLLTDAIKWWDVAEEHIDAGSNRTALVCVRTAITLAGLALEDAREQHTCRAIVAQLGGMVDCDTWLRQERAETVL